MGRIIHVDPETTPTILKNIFRGMLHDNYYIEGYTWVDVIFRCKYTKLLVGNTHLEALGIIHRFFRVVLSKNKTNILRCMPCNLFNEEYGRIRMNILGVNISRFRNR
jgi:hypothetical protein